MARTDGPHVDFPCHGARKLSRALRDEGFEWRSRRVAAGPMGRMACATPAPAQDPETSRPSKAGKFPYLLAGKPVTHPNQVWPTDIAYIRLGRSHACLGAVIDWFSRCIAAQRLHDDMRARNSARCMEDAFRDHGTPPRSQTRTRGRPTPRTSTSRCSRGSASRRAWTGGAVGGTTW